MNTLIVTQSQEVHIGVQDTIVILEEGNQPYPRCPQCDTFVPHKFLNGQKLKTELCRQGMERKWSCLAEEEAREGTEQAITAYGDPLYQAPSFKCLGRVLAAEDENWTAVVRNLRSARHKWVRLTQVLSRVEEDARSLGKIYLAVVQLVLLKG